MLSLFPSLLTWNLLSPLLIRLTLGAVLLFWAYKLLRNKKNQNNIILGTIECIIGILLVIGLWTQAASLIAAIGFLIAIIKSITKKTFLTDGINYYLILLVLAISLLVTGAGFLAFDLPL